MADVAETIRANDERFLETLLDYLRIPSISTDPAYREETRRCAHWLRDQFAAGGLEAELIETDGNPLVYAEWLGAKDGPTVLFYGHYDVQPPDPLDEWHSPPFEPTVENGRITARGATDDKGQSYTHLAACTALLEATGSLPCNVKFLIEGEEESGGEAIESYVRSEQGAQRIAADCVVVSDSSMFGPGQPSLLYGLRGMLYAEIEVKGPNRDLHSGTFGGAVRNPLNALSQIIAALSDPDSGRVAIPGFYDDVLPLEAWEKDQFGALPFDEDGYRRELGVRELFGEEGYSNFERTWARPSCDVHGLLGGYQGPGAKTVIPARGGAKVSMRLVPNQDPDKIAAQFRSWLADNTPSGVEAELHLHHGAPALLVDCRGPFMEAAQSALERVWGKAPVMVREGGSIPIVGTLHEVLAAPVLLIGLGQTDDRLHSPNEKFDLENFRAGIRVMADFLVRAGAIERERS